MVTVNSVLSNASTIWARLQARMQQEFERKHLDWREEIAKTAVTDKLEKRKSGSSFSDQEVFEALLLAMLSNNTGWEKIRLLKHELADQFHGFETSAFAECQDAEVDAIAGWFRSRRSASMTLRQDLMRLRGSMAKLNQFRNISGQSSDHYFQRALTAVGGSVVDLPLLLARPGEWKLPGFGVALSAEALRNLGYDLAKPDRHVLRAVGSWSLVSFAKWPDTSGRKAPVASEDELRETMLAVQQMAETVHEPTTLVDSTIWTACAWSGARLSNSELRSMAG